MGPEINYFTREQSNDKNVSFWELNFMAHYLFPISEELIFYPLTGFNHTIENIRQAGDIDTTIEPGLNLGAGLHLEFESVYPFFEYKYVLSKLDQHIFSLGMMFNINTDSKL